MAFLICGKEGAATKEASLPGVKSKMNTRHCFGKLSGLKKSSSSHKNRQMESFTVVISRGQSGFGFSVTGSNPAKVKVIKEDSTSHAAGLHKNDRVMRIDGHDVSQLPAENVAKIVRQADREIVLDIERAVPVSRRQSEKSSNASPSTGSKQQQKNWGTNGHPDTGGKHAGGITHTGQLMTPNTEYDMKAAFYNVIQCEKDFLSQMKFGLERYFSPLRNGMISAVEHAILFQNAETLLSVSEYHVYKLEEAARFCNDPDMADHFIDIVGSVYLPKLLMMTEVFEQYCNGIKQAFRLLEDIKNLTEFKTIIQESSLESNQPTISGFLQKPLEYTRDLFLSLQRLLVTAPLHQNATNLSRVVDALRLSCNSVNNSSLRRVRSMASVTSRSSAGSVRSHPGSTRSHHSRASGSSISMMSCESGSSAKSGDSSIEASLDPEVIQIQRRLLFSDHVKAFQLATATRHMIYAGELQHVDGEQLYVVLMSDFLLLTKMIEDDRLLVVDYPLLLSDIIHSDFMSPDTLDFCLTAESGIDEEWVEECDITLRAPSLEQKYTWKNILEQRIKSCRAHQEFLSSENFI